MERIIRIPPRELPDARNRQCRPQPIAGAASAFTVEVGHTRDFAPEVLVFFESETTGGILDCGNNGANRDSDSPRDNRVQSVQGS